MHQSNFFVEKMCNCFKISQNSFYKWKAGRSTKRVLKENYLAEKIKGAWEESRYTYGSPRVCKELKNAREKVSISLIAQMMRKYGFRSVHKKKFRVTTDSKYSYYVTENVLNRDFTAQRPAQKWVSDLTYIQTKEGRLYLIVIIDLFDRKVIGWSFSSGMSAQETIIPMWRMACLNRPIEDDLIFHSDRVVQYACKTLRNLLKTP